MRSHERLNRQEILESENYGGYEDPRKYRKKPDQQYCDKGDHKQRSICHQPNHINHWKKKGQCNGY